MSFGSCCILDGSRYSLMDEKSVEVKGEELGLLFNFEVTQTFYHEESSPKKVSYIFPNDLKMCHTLPFLSNYLALNSLGSS